MNAAIRVLLHGVLVGVASASLLACGADSPRGLRVGMDGTSDGRAGTGVVDVDNPDGSTPPVPTGSALEVEIQDDAGMQVEIIVVACGGACVELEARASGGYPPYAYRWEDGSTDAMRTVCLDAASTISVTATDTAIDTEELSHEATTVSTEAAATVLACTDGGAPDVGEPEPRTCAVAATEALPWESCGTTADMIIALAEPLEAGESYGLRVSGEGGFIPDGYWDIEIWGSNSDCTLGTRLASYREMNGPNDMTLCLAPEQRFTHLVYHLVSGTAAKLATLSYALCDSCAP